MTPTLQATTARPGTPLPEPGGLDVVTGAFSYSGSAITRELLGAGRRVRTLTGHPERAGRSDPGRSGRSGASPDVEVRPLDFDDPLGLAASMEGASTLYNTYWVRFPRNHYDHDVAVANSRTLFHAARRAGVGRIVHVSITHPSGASPYAYFRGKAEVERALAEVGVSFAVLRPAILFGGDGVLVNNIAWLLRHLPVFAIGGSGRYRIRAVHVDDLARLCVEAGAGTTDTVTDAVGPERPTFEEMVRTIRGAVGSRSRLLHVPGWAVPALSGALGLVLRDVLLTGEEYRAMASGLADTDGPATGEVALSSWIAEHRADLGVRYANELDRHFR